MMQRLTVSLAAVLAGLLAVAASALAQTAEGREEAIRQEIREALKVMTRQIEALHDEIIRSLGALGDRTTFARAQNVLANFVQMARGMDRNVPLDQIREDYARADRSLLEMLKFIDGLGPSYRALHQAADRVKIADRELHFAVLGDLPGGTVADLLVRQARGLIEASESLEKASTYALSSLTTGKELLADEKQFLKSVRGFDQAVKQKRTEEQLRKSFKEVLNDWDHVVLGLKKLPPRENVYLLRTASRVDGIQDRLFSILRMPGKRSRLPTSTE